MKISSFWTSYRFKEKVASFIRHHKKRLPNALSVDWLCLSLFLAGQCTPSYQTPNATDSLIYIIDNSNLFLSSWLEGLKPKFQRVILIFGAAVSLMLESESCHLLLMWPFIQVETRWEPCGLTVRKLRATTESTGRWLTKLAEIMHVKNCPTFFLETY